MKIIKKSWGYDYILDKKFLVTFIVIAFVLLSITLLLLYGHDKICQTKDPLLIFLDRVFFTILKFLGLLGGSTVDFNIPSC